MLCPVVREATTVTDLSGSHSTVVCAAIKDSAYAGLLLAALTVASLLI
jgi:hypothetical protein